MKSIESTRFWRAAAVGCVLLNGACGADPGTPVQGEGSPAPQSTEPSSSSSAERLEPAPIVEEPGVALSTMGSLFDSRSIVTQVMAAAGDEYASHQELTIKAQFRPDLTVEVDPLRERAEAWK